MAKPAKGKCPICGKATTAASAPFCSERCRSLDLANWLDGKYTVPVVESEPDEEQNDE